MKFPSKVLASFMVAVLLSLVVLSPAMPSKASTSYIEPISYSGSYSDFQAYLSAESLSIDVCLWILGFITLCVVTARNVDLNLNLTTTSSFQDKLTAYGNYACSHLWSSVKDIAYGIISWQNANNCYSWSALTHVGFSNLLSLVKSVSIGAGDFVYSPSETAQGLIDMSGVPGTSLPQPFTTDKADFDILCTSAYGTVYNNVLAFFNTGTVFNFNYFTNIDFSRFDSIILFNNCNSALFCNLVNNTLVRTSTSFDIVQAVGRYSWSTPSWSTLNAVSSQTGVSITFNPSSRSYYSNVDIYGIVSYFSSYGINVYYTSREYLEGSSWIYGTNGISAVVGSVPAVVNSDSNYLVFPSAEDITVDLTTVPDRLADLTDTSTVNQRVEALTNISADSISSATDSSIGNINTPTYDFPSLGDVWKYPRYLFNLTRPFLLLCKDSLDAVTVGQGGLSWLFFGAFVMAVCGGVIGKFLE